MRLTTESRGHASDEQLTHTFTYLVERRQGQVLCLLAQQQHAALATSCHICATRKLVATMQTSQFGLFIQLGMIREQ